MENQTCIRAERKALDMLYPAELPSPDIPVVDEDYIDSEAVSLDEPEPIAVADAGEPPEPEDEIFSEEHGGGGGETVSETAEGEETQKNREQASAAERDPASVKSFGDLYTVCRQDWPSEFNERKDVWNELGYSCQEDIFDHPSDCYRKIKAARSAA